MWEMILRGALLVTLAAVISVLWLWLYSLERAINEVREAVAAVASPSSQHSAGIAEPPVEAKFALDATPLFGVIPPMYNDDPEEKPGEEEDTQPRIFRTKAMMLEHSAAL